MCRIVLILGLLLCGSASNATTVFTIDEQTNKMLDLAASVRFLEDKAGKLDLQDVMSTPVSAFQLRNTELELQGPTTLWTKVQLTNTTAEGFAAYFLLFSYVDTIFMYTVQEGRVIDRAFTGNDLSPRQKHLSTNYNNLLFSLVAGETKTFYFRFKYEDLMCPTRCVHRFRIIESIELNREKMRKISFQSFYGGIILFLALIGLFMYALFREQIFLWFSLMMFAFMVYFAIGQGIADLLIDYHMGQVSATRLLSTVCVVVAFTFFVDRYLRLRQRSPRLSSVYIGMACLVGVITLVVLGIGTQAAMVYIDLATVIWILLTMAIIVRYFRRTDKASVVLLVSVLLLFIGSLLHILSLYGVLGEIHAFQIGSLAFSATLFYGMIDRINTIRHEKQRMEELDQLKSRFFANISHEFRTPLTLVLGPIKDVLQRIESPHDRRLLQSAQQNAARLLDLINQLLDLAKLDAHKMKLRVSPYPFATLLEGIVMSFESLARRKQIVLHFAAPPSPLIIYLDKDRIEKIFYNLLSNAFAFTPAEGTVRVQLTELADRVEVTVQDTGIGIPAERLTGIFDRFAQVDSDTVREHEGSGIGLALVKELVELHHGKIDVTSQVDVGTSFVITFLKGKAHFSAEDIESETPVPLPVDTLLLGKDGTEGLVWHTPDPLDLQIAEDAVDEADHSTPLVLLIEDNAAVRNYVKQHLATAFRIVEAVDGQEGIDSAVALLPDLIISDVMMPVKNGYEVCETLKTDQRTSHIPIILLTAKAGSEEKIEGLQIGADDYLVKPFDTRELEIRSHNLIRSRELLRKKFSEAETIEPLAVSTNAYDQAFLEKVCHHIDENMAETQFGVEYLAREMNLSRSQLNRKLRALTDQSANKFIQTYRLQKARELLRQGTGNVTEIAMQTGFNSTAYFIKCFGDKYGHTPGSLLK